MEDDERRAEIEALEMMYSCNRISEDSKNKSISFRLELETLGLAPAVRYSFHIPRSISSGGSRNNVASFNSEQNHAQEYQRCFQRIRKTEKKSYEIVVEVALKRVEKHAALEVVIMTEEVIDQKEEKASMRTSNFKSNEEKSGILMNSTVEGEAASSDDGERKTAKKKNATIKEELLHMRQWIWFIGVLHSQNHQGLRQVRWRKGPESSINDFLRITRTQLFASVAPSSRKMKLIHHESITSESRCFDSFSEVEMACLSGTHKRKDLTDLGELQRFLKNAGCGHAFSLIFNNALKT